MPEKPTYEELERRIKELEQEAVGYKQMKKAWEENAEKFRLLYERAPIGCQSLDVNGNFVAVNHVWLDILGYEKEEVLGKSFGDFLSPEWTDHFRENFSRFKAIGEILGVDTTGTGTIQLQVEHVRFEDELTEAMALPANGQRPEGE